MSSARGANNIIPMGPLVRSIFRPRPIDPKAPQHLFLAVSQLVIPPRCDSNVKKVKSMKKGHKKSQGKKERVLEKVVVTLLVVFVSLLSFSVGVMSGKGLSDKEYELKNMDTKYAHALGNQESQGADGSEDLTEEEIEQLANAALESAELIEEQNTAEPAANPVVAQEAGKKPAQPEKVAPATEKEVRVPSSVKKMAPTVGYTVQVAAFPEFKEAESRAAALVKKGYAAFPMKINIKGKTWYRVNVGSFKTRKQALSYRSRLTKSGAVKDAIIKKLIN